MASWGSLLPVFITIEEDEFHATYVTFEDCITARYSDKPNVVWVISLGTIEIIEDWSEEEESDLKSRILKEDR